MCSVINRNGVTESFNKEEIVKRLKCISNDNTIYFDEILDAFSDYIVKNNITSIRSFEIDEKISEIMSMQILDNPKLIPIIDYLYVSNIVKSSAQTFKEYYELMRPMLKKKYAKFIRENMNFISNLYKKEHNYVFKYQGVKVLTHGYMIRGIENPAFLLLRTSIQLCNNNLDELAAIYNGLLSFKIMFPTPTLYNSCLKVNQLSSCFLLNVEKDRIDDTTNSIKDISNISFNSGGVGINVSNTPCDILNILDKISKYIKPEEKRSGNIAAYLDLWNSRLIKFINSRSHFSKENTNGDVCEKVFLGLMIPDLFFKRYLENGVWSLFDYEDSVELSKYYGEEFEIKYSVLELEKKFVQQYTCKEIFEKILNTIKQAGVPYLLARDTINNMSNEKNLGIVQNSNLCAEIVEVANKGKIAVCNLASLGLCEFVKDNKFDFDDFGKHVRLLVRAVTNMCSESRTDSTTDSNIIRSTRAIGIGDRGLADLFIKLGYPFESDEARKLNKDIAEHKYFYALSESVKLAKEIGPYQGFIGSPLSLGKLHFMNYTGTEYLLDENHHLPWNKLRKDIIDYGVANSLLIALMPTVSTSRITGHSDSFEPIKQLIIGTKTSSGFFKSIYSGIEQYISIKELISHEGSLQNTNVPDHIKEIYKTVYEMNPMTLLDMAIDRQMFIDQTQSYNHYISEEVGETTISRMAKLIIYAWFKKMKTLSYYTRFESKATIRYDVTNIKQVNSDMIKDCNLENECESCTA